MNKTFLKRHKTSIVDGQGKPVLLKGVNFGGWLMMEAYFVYAPNLPQQIFEKEFAKQCGAKALNELMGKFRDNFITEADFKQVASWGMNCIRLPFHYKVAADAQSDFIFGPGHCLGPETQGLFDIGPARGLRRAKS